MQTLKEFWQWVDSEKPSDQLLEDKAGKDGPLSEEAQEAMDEAFHIIQMRSAPERCGSEQECRTSLKYLSLAILQSWSDLPVTTPGYVSTPRLPEMSFEWQPRDPVQSYSIPTRQIIRSYPPMAMMATGFDPQGVTIGDLREDNEPVQHRSDADNFKTLAEKGFVNDPDLQSLMLKLKS